MSCCIDCCCDEPQERNSPEFPFCAYNGRHECHRLAEEKEAINAIAAATRGVIDAY